MAGVVGWDEGSFAAPLNQCPALMSLLVVVVSAEPVEEIEGGDLRLGEVRAMVVLQSDPG